MAGYLSRGAEFNIHLDGHPCGVNSYIRMNTNDSFPCIFVSSARSVYRLVRSYPPLRFDMHRIGLGNIPGNSTVLGIESFPFSNESEVLFVLCVAAEEEKPTYLITCGANSVGDEKMDTQRVRFHAWASSIRSFPLKKILVLLNCSTQYQSYSLEKIENKWSLVPSTSGHLPELNNMSSLFCLDSVECTMEDEGKVRLTACGTQNGTLALSMTQENSDRTMRKEDCMLDGPIAFVKFGYIRTSKTGRVPDVFSRERNSGISVPVFENEPLDKYFPALDGEIPSNWERVLFVSAAQSGFVIFHDVEREFLRKPQWLTGMDEFDSVLCMTSADFNHDNTQIILLGTYGGYVMEFSEEDSFSSLRGKHLLSSSVYCIDWVDLMGDGVRELVINTTYSLQVFPFIGKEKLIEKVEEKLRLIQISKE